MRSISPSTHSATNETFTFRIEPELKAAFIKLAEAEHVPAGKILREFIAELVRKKQRIDFAREARRQSKVIAEAASHSSNDEAEILAQLDRAFDELTSRRDWK